MPVVGTQTVYINVTDLDRSIAWYEKVGFKCIQRIETATGWPVLRTIDMPLDSKAMIGMMILKEGTRGNALVNLVQWINPLPHGKATHRPPHSDLAHVGLARLSLKTVDVRGEYDRLIAEGVEFISTPEDLPADEFIDGGCCVTALDPDGAVIILIELHPKASARATYTNWK